MSDYGDGGMSGTIVDQQIQQLAAQEIRGEPAGTPPLWELPALIVFIAALTWASVWLSRRRH